MGIKYFSISKSGGRKNNEDRILCDSCNGSYLFALADGLGGHGRGEYASKLAVEKSAEVFRSGITNKNEMLRECFEQVQVLLLEAQGKSNDRAGMKTTLVLLYLDHDRMVWGHIGDSRLYQFENGILSMKTLDHSVPQMLVAMGEIKDEEIRHHEDRNRLLRVLGAEWGNSKYEIIECNKGPQPGDVFLLCSDGFWELVDESCMMKTLIRARTPEQWILKMEKVLLNNKVSSMDNYSAVAVFCARVIS